MKYYPQLNRGQKPEQAKVMDCWEKWHRGTSRNHCTSHKNEISRLPQNLSPHNYRIWVRACVPERGRTVPFTESVTSYQKANIQMCRKRWQENNRTNRRAKTPQRNTSPRSPLKIESRLQDVKTGQRSSARLHVQITNGHESSDGKSQSFLPNARTIQAGTSDPAPICPQTLLSPTRCVLDKQAHNFAHRLCSENAECMKQHIYCFAHRLSLVRGLRKWSIRSEDLVSVFCGLCVLNFLPQSSFTLWTRCRGAPVGCRSHSIRAIMA